ncbi:response regulator [Sphingomonas naasensis]|uniref:Response regulator n=2 Tax=Sphingomonas naasensis TaxID=1344951 RepID=A0A4S1WJ07_9SPHN|nr:response regulator [Sphingomonas naasensis]
MIAIVDDDAAVREALFDFLQVENLPARAFAAAADFLADPAIASFACVITDIRMPDIDGLELQRRLRARGSAMPVIFITSTSEEATRVRAMRGGAIAFLTKPFDDEALLGILRTVLGGRP